MSPRYEFEAAAAGRRAAVESRILATADTDDIRRLLNLARDVACIYNDMLRAHPNPAPYSTERVTLARLNSALGHLTADRAPDHHNGHAADERCPGCPHEGRTA